MNKTKKRKYKYQDKEHCWSNGRISFEQFGCKYFEQFEINGLNVKHCWSNGRISPCQGGGPGSIPGRCNPFFFF